MDGSRRVIHPKSSVAPLPQLDLFTVPPTQCSIEKDVDSEIRPLSTLAANQPIEFIVNSSLDEYINFSETYLYVKCRVKLTRADGKNAEQDDWSSVVPVQYFLHSLFSQVDVLVANNEITIAPQTYQYRALIEAMLAFSDSAKNTHLKASLYASKEERQAAIAPSTNLGNEGKWFEMMGRLHLDLTFQQKLVIGGCDFKLKLLPSDPKFYFNISKSTLKAELEFNEVRLHVHKSRVFPSIVAGHNNAIRHAPATYQITRSEVKRIGIPKGQIDYIQDVIRGHIPRRMFVMLVDTAAYNGHFEKDPFEFKHYNCNFCAVYMNSMQYPTKAYTPDFEKGLFVREYMKLMQALDQNGTDVYTDLTLEKFGKNHTLFAFDFAPDLSNGPGASGHANIMMDGVLRLALRFNKQTPETINVLMYCEFDECFGIDMNRCAVKAFD
jgi:hypothetical protein